MKRTIFSTLLILLALTASAQFSNIKQLRFLLNNQGDTTAASYNNGRMWYDFTTNQFRATRNATNITLSSGGAGGGITGTLTATRVPFATGASTISDDAALTWNNTSKFLTINNQRIGRFETTAASGEYGLYIGNGAGVATNFTVSRLGNVAIGTNALSSLTDGVNFYDASYNTAVGYGAGQSGTTAAYNAYFGYRAGGANVTGIQSAGFGYFALRYFTGGSNTAFGHLALQGASGLSTGTENTAVGRTALSLLQTGSRNVAMGPCLQALVSGSQNVVGGSESFERLTTQSNNTGWGHWAGVYNRGSSNTAIGAFAMGQATVDSPSNTGSSNVAVGVNAGVSITTGSFNTFLGGGSNTGGTGTQVSYATALGYNSRATLDYSMTFGSPTDAERVNYGFGGEDFGSGRGISYFKNATVTPTGEPTNGFWLYSGSGTATLVPSAKIFKFRANSLGATATDAFYLDNDVDAAAGAQQYSPFIRWRGRGWKTAATAASQTIDFDAGVTTTQGSSAPTGNWLLRTSVNGAAYTTAINVDTDLNNFGIAFLNNTLRISGTTNNTIVMAGASVIRGNSLTNQFNVTSVIPAAGYGVGIKNLNPAATYTSGSFSETSIGTGYAPTSGTGIYNTVTIDPTINQTGGANGNLTMLNIAPIYTAVNGVPRGIYYNPSSSPIGHIAAEFVSGEVRLGTVAKDTAPTQVLVRNSSTGAIEYRDNGTVTVTNSDDLGGANSVIYLSTLDPSQKSEMYFSNNVNGSWDGAFTSTNVLNTVPDNSIILVRATFTGVQTSGTAGSSAFHYVVERAFRRTTTTTTAVGAATIISSSNDTGDTFSTVPTVSTSGSNINFERALTTTKTFRVFLKINVTVNE